MSRWWRSRASSSRLVCCLIHDDDALVAAIPLEYSKLPVTTWTSTNLHWGWSSALIDPTADERWTRPYAQWLGDGAGPWASVQMGLLPIDGPANRQLRAFEGSGHKRFWVRDLASLDLTGGYDAFIDRQSKNLRRKIRRTETTATENGLSRKVCVQPAPDYLHAVVGTVSSRSWQGTTGRAVYSDPANREFYRLLSRDSGDLQLVLNHVESPAGLPHRLRPRRPRGRGGPSHRHRVRSRSSPITPPGCSPPWTPSDGRVNRDWPRSTSASTPTTRLDSPATCNGRRVWNSLKERSASSKRLRPPR